GPLRRAFGKSLWGNDDRLVWPRLLFYRSFGFWPVSDRNFAGPDAARAHPHGRQRLRYQATAGQRTSPRAGSIRWRQGGRFHIIAAYDHVLRALSAPASCAEPAFIRTAGSIIAKLPSVAHSRGIWQPLRTERKRSQQGHLLAREPRVYRA